jgi:hypothetical protein
LRVGPFRVGCSLTILQRADVQCPSAASTPRSKAISFGTIT